MSKEETNKFSLEIEKIAAEKSVSHMDAVIFYCEKTGLEIELTAKLISSSLKTKIKLEAEKLQYLPKSSTNKLPV